MVSWFPIASLAATVLSGAVQLPGVLFAESNVAVVPQLDEMQRLRILASLVVIATATSFLLLFVLAAGRITRWYVNRQPRATKLKGDPFGQVIDGKPRIHQREAENWRQR